MAAGNPCTVTDFYRRDGFSGTGTQLRWMAALAVVIAFCSASQDIVFDARKTDVLPAEERGTGAAISVLGYRLGMLVSGGLALWMADRWLGWQGMYWLMAALMIPCIIATLLAPEPTDAIPVPKTLEQAVVAPLRDFFGRNNARLILLLIVLYKLGDAFAMSLTTTFLIRGVGFDAGEVGVVNKTLGLLATIVGALYGGILMQRLSLFRALLIFGILQGRRMRVIGYCPSLTNTCSVWRPPSSLKTCAVEWARQRLSPY